MYTPGDEDSVSESDRNKILEKIRNSALYLLTRRDHTRLELAQKLSRKGHSPEDIDQVLTSIENTGLINPARFAENYTHYRQSRGYGPMRIRMELQTKGVPEPIIAELIKITDNAWFSRAIEIWQKHFKGQQPRDQRERAKQMRFLHNRGFTHEQVNNIFKDNHGQNE